MNSVVNHEPWTNLIYFSCWIEFLNVNAITKRSRISAACHPTFRCQFCAEQKFFSLLLQKSLCWYPAIRLPLSNPFYMPTRVISKNSNFFKSLPPKDLSVDKDLTPQHCVLLHFFTPSNWPFLPFLPPQASARASAASVSCFPFILYIYR